MNEPKFHPWFHKLLICFALWAYALIAFIQGVVEIMSAKENGASNATGVIVCAVLLMLVGLFAVMTRFDLAALRPRAPIELLILGLASAGVLIALHFLLDIDGGDEGMPRVIAGVILALWGIALYRYYRQRAYLFKGASSN